MPLSFKDAWVDSLMAAYRLGDPEAGNLLFEALYPELKRLAAKKLRRERDGHSWQPTLLVNELYLHMVKIKALPPKSGEEQNNRAAFLALAGQIMKRLLIHHARPLANKAKKIPVWEELSGRPENDIAELDHLLARLEAIKPLLRQVVEKKVFDGLTAEEIAVQLGCAVVTVNRYWQFSRRWLAKELAD